PALNRLGWLAESGAAGQVDLGRAIEYYTRAAALGDVDGMFNLAVMYLEGHGIPTDSDVGLVWLNRAAKLNHADAVYVLATIYDEGLIVPQDLTRAADLYLLSAELGGGEA